MTADELKKRCHEIVRVERNRRRRHRKAAAKHYRDTVRVEGRAAHEAPKDRRGRNEYYRLVRDAKIFYRAKQAEFFTRGEK